MTFPPVRYTLAIALAALPWLFPFTAGPSAAVVPWLASAACGLGLLLVSSVQGVRLSPALVFVGLGIVAWAFLASGGQATQDIVALAGGLALVGVAAANAGAVESSINAGLRHGLLVAAALSAIVGLVQYAGWASVAAPWVDYAQIGVAFGNLRQPNQFTSLCWLGMAVLLWGKPRLPMKAAAPTAVLLALASASSVSRTAIFQGLLLTALAAIWDGPERQFRLRLCIVAGVAYIAATIALPFLLEVTTGVLPARTLWGRISGGASCSSRSVLWGNVATLIAQRPAFGWGWGELDFAHFMTLYPGARFCDILDNAHNLPLHIAVELGVPAAVVLCGLGLAGAWRRRPWQERDPQRQLAWALLGVIMLHSLVEYPLWYGPFQIVFGTCLGWLARSEPPSTEGTIARWRGVAIAWVLLAALGYAGWDYWRVSQVYLPPERREARWRDDPLAVAHRSWLFEPQADFAELTLTQVRRDNASHVASLAQAMLHYSPEPAVIERLIEADTLLDRRAEAVTMLARYMAAFPREAAAWRADHRRAAHPAGGGSQP